MKFDKNNHIVGKVYDLTQENMCAMLAYIDELEKFWKEEFSKEVEEMNKCL